MSRRLQKSLIPDPARRVGGSRARRGAARKFPVNYASDDDNNGGGTQFERFPDTESETEEMDTRNEDQDVSEEEMDTRNEDQDVSEEEMQVEEDVDVGKSDPERVVHDIRNEPEVRTVRTNY